jgi:hypothetical protein
MTAALGITRIRWALRPPYSDLAPSSARTSLNVCSRPVYLTLPLTSGCRNRVRRTWHGATSISGVRRGIRIGAAYLVRVCYQAGDAFRGTRAAHHARPLLPPALALRPGRQPLQLLVERPLYRALRHPEIARAEALVEPAQALLARYSPDHGDAVAQHPFPRRSGRRRREVVLRLLELQTRLHDPYGIGRAAGAYARDRRGAEMDVCVLLAVVEVVGDDLLAVSIGEKVDGASGDDADKRRTQALE